MECAARRSLVAIVVVSSCLAVAACSGSNSATLIEGEESDAGPVRASADARAEGGAASDANQSIDTALPKDGGGADVSVTDAGTDVNTTDGSSSDVDAASVVDANRVDVNVPDAVADGQCFDVALGQVRALDPPGGGDLLIDEWIPNPSAVVDSKGEWIEVLVTRTVDINGLQVGTATLTDILVSRTNCVQVAAGSYLLFARSNVAADNGLNGVPVDGTFSFMLPNSNGTLRLGVDNAEIDSVNWATSSGGKSVVIDSNGTQCNAPPGTSAYNGTDIGTPRAANTPDCP